MSGTAFAKSLRLLETWSCPSFSKVRSLWETLHALIPAASTGPSTAALDNTASNCVCSERLKRLKAPIHLGCPLPCWKAPHSWLSLLGIKTLIRSLMYNIANSFICDRPPAFPASPTESTCFLIPPSAPSFFLFLSSHPNRR